MSDEPAQQPSIADLIARGFSFPLVCLMALVGVAVGIARYQAERDAIRPKDPSEIAAPVPGGTEDGPGGGGQPPANPDVSPREIEDALRAGDYDKARELANGLGNTVFIERANLFHSLTHQIEPGVFAKAEAVQRVRGPDGPLVGLVREDGGKALVTQLDGRERSLPKSALASQEELRGEDKDAALREALLAARDELGAKAGGLALHRLAYLAFAAGLRPLGARFLTDALEGPEGSILVDMFGEGDFERLHRAQRLLSGKLAQDPPEPVAVAQRDPVPEPSRSPDPPSQPDPPPSGQRPEEGSKTTVTRSADGWVITRRVRKTGNNQADPLLTDPAWKESNTAYRSGLKLYRGTYGMSNRMAAISIKAALKEFQAAQTQLDPLNQRYPDHHELERRQQELAQLVIDCMRRLRIDD